VLKRKKVTKRVFIHIHTHFADRDKKTCI